MNLYQDGLFEWTHFKAKSKGYYLMPIIVAIINIIKVDNAKFEAKIKEDSKTLEAEFNQVKSADDGGCALVNGTVVIYKEDDAADEKDTVKWAIFKRNDGDPFLFRNLFESVVRHPQIKELLLVESQ